MCACLYTYFYIAAWALAISVFCSMGGLSINVFNRNPSKNGLINMFLDLLIKKKRQILRLPLVVGPIQTQKKMRGKSHVCFLGQFKLWETTCKEDRQGCL